MRILRYIKPVVTFFEEATMTFNANALDPQCEQGLSSREVSLSVIEFP